MEKTITLDNLDKNILNTLMHDARTPFLEIARKNNVSGPTIHQRMAKLEAMGIIDSIKLIVKPDKMGYHLTVFIGVFLEKGSLNDHTIQILKEIPEVTECYYTTGNYSLFLKLRCRNTEHLMEILNKRIQPIQGVERTETIISLEQSINRQIVP